MRSQLLQKQDSLEDIEGNIKQLNEMLEALKAAAGDSDADDEMQKKKKKEKKTLNKKLSSNLHLLYAATKVKIFKIADKIQSCGVPKDEELCDESEVEIPIADSWDFKLGDNVKINYSLEDFKSIQSRTLGWNARLRTIHGCIGIVTRRNSSYENAVGVYMPARLSASSLYAGLLQKVSPEEHDDPVPSAWKVNEYVTTKMDLKVVKLMQRRLDTIPMDCLGRKGRIIAVTRVAVVVTFDERVSYDINSYLLTRCPDQSPIIQIPVENKKGLKDGDKVKMLSNLKKLIANQKDKGGWNSSMSNLAGKEVTIIHVRDDGTLNLQYKLGKSWRMNSDSVVKPEETGKAVKEDDVEFVRGDIVKIRMVSNIRMLLEAKSVPLVFLEYLRSAAVVKLIDDDLDYLIRYNCDQTVSAYAKIMRKATLDEVQTYKEIKSMQKQITIGSQVYLDVGPPNYVHAMLAEVNASREVIHALTNPATLVGFAKDHRAVIEYKDGSRYKIKKKFLTVPDKFKVYDTIKGLDLEVATEIHGMVATCVQIIHEEGQVESAGCQSAVKILSMSYGTPSAVDLRVFSMKASFDKICELLIQICGWDVEIACAGKFYINKMESFSQEVQVSLYFNDEEYAPGSVKVNLAQSNDSATPKPQQQGSKATEALEPLMSEVDNQTIPKGAKETRPKVKKLEDFRYLPLYHPTFGKIVSVPFVMHGHQQQQQDLADRDYRQGGGIIISNSTIGSIEVNQKNIFGNT